MNNHRQRGFVRTIILILIAILLLSYFGIDLRQVTTTPLFNKNIQYTWEVTVSIWNRYVYDPISHIFKKKTPEATL